MEEALRVMNLGHLIDSFREKGIDYETLLLLQEFPENIPNFVPNIVDQLKLKKGLKSLVEGEKLIVLDVDLGLVTDSPATFSSSHTEACEVAQENRKRLRESDEIPSEETSAANAISQPSSYIAEILARSASGKAVLEAHRLFGFDNSTRCKLAELVINSEYGADTNTVIHCERFKILAGWIVDCFPGEVAETYYIPSNRRGKGKSASGKLYDSYTSINKELRKVKLRITNPGSASPSGGNSIRGIGPSVPPTPSDDDAAIKRALEFLEVQSDPWDQVKESWEKTSGFRLNCLRSNNSTALARTSDYLTKYPALTQPAGYLLIEHDFQVLFKHAENRMITHWPEFSNKLRPQLESEGIKNIESDVELLYNFPQLFSVVPVKVPGRRPWRASRAEIQEGFLVHVKVIADIEKKLEGMQTTVANRGTQLQPFPLIVGETLKSITSSYVVIDQKLIRVNSPLRAVEVVFKAYHALYCNYPLQAERLWLVLEKALFDIEEEWESNVRAVPEVIRLISTLKCN